MIGIKEVLLISLFLFLFYLFICHFWMKPREPFEGRSPSPKIVVSLTTSPKIVVSLTTSPKRIYFLDPLIRCLETQTVKPDMVVLNLPHVFKRTNEMFDKIPDFIENSQPFVKINRCEDIGPATKIIPTRSLFEDPETIIISVDDDIQYRDNFIETLLKYERMAPDAVITGESYMRIENKYSKGESKVKYAELVEGYSSVLYKKKHLDDFNVDELVNEYPKECFFADDFVISNYLRKKDIDIVVTDEEEENKTTVNIYMDHGNGEDALRNGANGNTQGNVENYKKCSAFLKSKGDLHVNHYDK
jgi:hypothetical protein